MAFSFLAYIFSFWRYLRFCIVSDDAVGGSTKQHNSQSRITLEILKQCSSNLASARYIIKETE